MTEPKLYIEKVTMDGFTTSLRLSRTEYDSADLYFDVNVNGTFVRLSMYKKDTTTLRLVFNADEAELLSGAFALVVKELRGEL